MTTIPEDDPKQPREDKGKEPRKDLSQAARRPTFESIFDALSREFGKPLSEIIPYLSVEAKARVLDMLLARMEEQERAPKGEGDDGTNS